VMHDLSRHRGFAIIAFVEDTEHIRFNMMSSFPRRVPLMEQELLTLPEHPSSSSVRVTRSLV
jgi:hypothetical protein